MPSRGSQSERGVEHHSGYGFFKDGRRRKGLIHGAWAVVREDFRGGRCELRLQRWEYTSGDTDLWARPLHVQRHGGRKEHCLHLSEAFPLLPLHLTPRDPLCLKGCRRAAFQECCRVCPAPPANSRKGRENYRERGGRGSRSVAGLGCPPGLRLRPVWNVRRLRSSWDI